MYWYFDDKIEKETINQLVDKLQNEDDIHLFFSTSGGYTDVMNYFINFLNTKKATIYLTDRLISAGTQLLANFKGNIVITDELDFIVFHLCDRQIYTLRKTENNVSEKILVNQTKEANFIFSEKLREKGLLTEKQLKDFFKGKDVIIYRNQFTKWNLKNN